MMFHKVFRGSRINYANIIFSRRFHPPMRGKNAGDPNSPVAAQWDNEKKEITFYLAGFRKSGYNSDSSVTRQEIIRVFIHETLHGVIDAMLEQDGIAPKGINHHWPHNNGMEYDSSLVESRVDV